jgi:mono/diheme cytochrome c family protein
MDSGGGFRSILITPRPGGDIQKTWSNMIETPSKSPLLTFFGALLLLGATAAAEDFPPDRIKAGASIYSRNCSPCHGTRMQNPEAAFDLRTFPPDEHERFVSSVTHGKNQMPPWGDLLDANDIESLWAYVMAGERR